MSAPTSIANIFTAPAGKPAPVGRALFNYLLVCIAVVVLFWVSLGVAGISLNFDFVGKYGTRIA